MRSPEKLNDPDKREKRHSYRVKALGKAAALGDAVTEIPDTYRQTNSMTASLATALISMWGNRKAAKEASESQNLPNGPELLPPAGAPYL